MNWIRKWCKERCEYDNNCNDCSEVCLPRFRLADAVGRSEYLIWILMFENGSVTHPNIADRITDYTYGTAADRDSIVAKEHRGTYKPNPNRKFNTRKQCGGSWNAKAVVAIDRLGHEIARWPSLEAAADAMGTKKHTISVRCNKVGLARDEFKPYGMSFRFESEWNRLTPEQRINDIQVQKERIR